MLFKKKGNIYSEITEVSQICATCKFASPLHAIDDDYMCKKKGLVSRDFCCKHYEYNRLLKRPPKKRNLNTERFSAEDFEI